MESHLCIRCEANRDWEEECNVTYQLCVSVDLQDRYQGLRKAFEVSLIPCNATRLGSIEVRNRVESDEV
jgi:hypothetical protein